MKTLALVTLTLALCLLAFALQKPALLTFEKITLDLGANETATFADLNNDGRLDLVAGENWFEAPRWTRHPFREFAYSNNYIDNLTDLALDVDGDGWTDIVSSTWFEKTITWWRNPGKAKAAWKKTVVESGHSVEFSFLVDLDNDGKAREVLPQFGSNKHPITWYEVKGGKLVSNAASPQGYGHGIGCGDVNGDGRNDILTPKGWLEAPPNPRSPDWTLHADWDLGTTGFLDVWDIDEDGRNDVLVPMAHGYGIYWLRNAGDGKWDKRLIDDSWSQPHATTISELDGYGKKDLLTGKRYMAHNGHDPGEREPLGIYWYQPRKMPDGRVDWWRSVIDYSTRTGAGMQLPVADVNGNGRLDFAAPGKSGLFLFVR